MLKKNVGLFVTLGVALFLGIILISMKISIQNTEIGKRQNVIAKEKVCKANFDKMFKTIRDVANVTDAARKSFEKVYPALMEGRYGKGDGSLMKWVTESNPTFNSSQYDKLIECIEANRDDFLNQQEQLADLQRDHDTYIKNKFNKWFLSDDQLKEQKITIITSTRTENTYKTGKDDSDDISNFGKSDSSK